MAKKVKMSNEAFQKAEEIITFHGYSSLEELVENLINSEYANIKSDEQDKDEQAEKLSGLGYIS